MRGWDRGRSYNPMELVMSEHVTELDVTHARQARRGVHAFIILVASMSLAIITLLATWTFYRLEQPARTGAQGAGQETAAPQAASGPARPSPVS